MTRKHVYRGLGTLRIVLVSREYSVLPPAKARPGGEARSLALINNLLSPCPLSLVQRLWMAMQR